MTTQRPSFHPVDAPNGRVKLGEKHTLLAGGLLTVLRDGVRKPLSDTIGDASRVCGKVLYAASRLLLLYATDTLAWGDKPFHTTGLGSAQSIGHKANMEWHGGAPANGDAPFVFTQELCEWSMSVFYRNRCTQTNTKLDAAFQSLERLAAIHGLVDALGGPVDNSHLGMPLHSLGKTLAVVISNHLTVATKAHTKLYLKAKYARLYLTNKEAEQLAVTIGRSVQWNDYRTVKLKGVPYNKLPPHRDAKEIKRYGETITAPEVDLMEWRAIVDAEWDLLPRTWTQSDMLRRRFAMLQTIEAESTPARPMAAFNLLPLCGSGRVFLKLNTAGLADLCKRAKVPITPKTVLEVFEPRKLERLLRHPFVASEKTRELVMGGEFFRSDGVQAQFYCGVPKGTKRSASGEAVLEDENLAAPESGVLHDPETEEEDIVSVDAPVPDCFEHMYACDPGRTNLYTVVKARMLDEAERLEKYPDLAPLGDGTYVVWEKVALPPERPGKFSARYLSMSRKAFDELRGGRARREERKAWVAGSHGYKEALAALSRAPLSCTDPDELADRIVVHFQNHAVIHALEGSQTMAHARMDAFQGKQRALAKISRDFELALGEKGILAWGGARWAVCAKGGAPCASAMIFKHLQKQRWTRLPGGRSRITTEAECNTSCKDSIGLGMDKMVHPRHARFCTTRVCYRTEFLEDGSKKREKIGKERLGVLGGGRPHGLYLCKEGQKRTCSRDINGASNIWRAYWERCHGRGRPATLCSKRSKHHGDAPAKVREGQP